MSPDPSRAPGRLGRGWRLGTVVAAGLLVCLAPSTSHAYVGPGAGFALVSSFLTFVVAFFTAFFAMFTFPVRWVWRSLRRKKPPRKASVRRVILLGLDGLDPLICEKMMAAGELPNLAGLKARGTYRRLGTSNPAMSPVAWSSFATGADASHHGIYDFLSRDVRTYLPTLSSSRVYGASRFWRLGPLRFAYRRGGVRLLRKSESFWKTLSDYGIFSTVLRVPITFPPERINGLILAGMDVPDLRGTMGTFTYYTQSEAEEKIGGMVIRLPKDAPAAGNAGGIETTLSGPRSPVSGETLRLDMSISRSPAGDGAEVRIAGQTILLREREYSPWVRLTFKAAPNLRLTGIARFYVTRLNGDFGMYVSPIHIAPDRPVMPVSSPPYYSVYLAKLLGPYGTLGLAEDTWAINERVLDEDGFLEQAYLFHEERKKMWFHSLDRLRRGLLCCVFDLSDRLQHICFRYLDDDHPANRDKDTTRHKEALFDMYREMDRLVGDTLRYEDDETAVFVLSDHGFKTFQRGVNLNSWFRENGYLAVKEGVDGGEYLSAVDWTRTSAYAVGLGGVYLNLEGRERRGTVDPGERDGLKAEISAALTELADPQTGKRAVNRVTDVARDFKGPYRNDGPDLLVGFAEGFRVSWDCARGVVTRHVFEDNVKSWSGDHCMDPDIVPGILFTNLKIEDEDPSLMDLAPTVLDLFGIDAPAHMVGKSLVSRGSMARERSSADEATQGSDGAETGGAAPMRAS